MACQGRVWVGTSGWHYRHWAGTFYPAGLPPDGYLAWYAQRFSSVEINTTFYGLPAEATVRAWRDATPEGFVFACKASRYITHMKKLRETDMALTRFLHGIAPIRDRLGPVLFQLPPHWGRNVQRLNGFLDSLPSGLSGAFEFRDASWFCPPVYQALHDHGAALCVYDLSGWRSPVRVTSTFVYLRLHGPAPAYGGSYDGRTLRGWARRIDGWRAAGLNVYCYFNNDRGGHAVANAARLSRMLV